MEHNQRMNDESYDDTEMTDFMAQVCSNGSEVSGKSKPSSLAAGRPMHGNWHGYKKVHINGKHAAKCLNCSRTFPNTAKHRLQTHR